MNVNRREFLKIGAVGTAGLAVAGYGANKIVTSIAQEVPEKIDEKYVSSVCLQCPGACGIKVRVVNGRAVKIEGNPLHPLNEGRLCPKGQAGLQVLYDPDRIKGPLKRIGKRGEGKWKQISWDEAITEVASKMKELRNRGDAHKFVLIDGRCRGQFKYGFLSRFLNSYGTPNHIGHGSICSMGSEVAHELTQNAGGYVGYDWNNTNYILDFGGSFLEAWRPTTRLLKSYGHFRRGRPNRAKFVLVDVRHSVTASKADEFIPIKPGTDGAFALGIAHVIISEKLYNEDFVNEHTYGFEEFKKLVLEEYTPQWASDETGIPVETIKRIAREFAKNQPAIASGERGASMQTNGITNRMAIHALNALVGSFGVPGGIISQKEPPFTPWPELVKDSTADEGLKKPRIDLKHTPLFPISHKVFQHLPFSILNEEPYNVEMIMVYYSNPLFSSPTAVEYREAFKKVPYVVSMSPFMDETSMQADLILPDHTYLERYHDDPPYPSVGFQCAGMRFPAVEPLYDTMNSGDVLIKIAKEIGGTMSQNFPWNSFLDVIKYRWEGIYKQRQGKVGNLKVWDMTSFDEFWKAVEDKGVWSNQPYHFYDYSHELRTPSGKFEFKPQNLKKQLDHYAEGIAKDNGIDMERATDVLLEKIKYSARGDKMWLIHYESPRFVGNKTKYPLHFVTYKLITHAEGRGANVPFLQEILGVHVNEAWDSWIEINPKTGQKLGIKNGEEVWVESPKGKIKAKAAVWEGVGEDVVAMPYELGHTAYGNWAKGRGANPNDIIVYENDYLGGSAAWFSTMVDVYSVERGKKQVDEKDMTRYECKVCEQYTYDPGKGDPDAEGGVTVAPGTPFDDVSGDWVCPVCGASKDNFEALE